MTEAIKPLEEVRRELDEIDNAMHDLIMRRTRVVEQVAAAKSRTSTANFVPGREVLVLRRLLARHEGAFRRQALVRIWRELISVFAAIQGPFHVVAYAEDGVQGFWDLARDNFGSHDTMSVAAAPREVVAKVANGEAAIGVAPVPADGDDDAWWRMLCGAVAPRIVARLPFIEGSNARNEGVEAFAVAKVAPDATGDDRSLLVVETASEMSRAGLRELLVKAGLTVRSIVPDPADVKVHLIEVDGFFTAEDATVERLAAADEIGAIYVIGAYGVPVRESEEAAS